VNLRTLTERHVITFRKQLINLPYQPAWAILVKLGEINLMPLIIHSKQNSKFYHRVKFKLYYLQVYDKAWYLGWRYLFCEYVHVYHRLFILKRKLKQWLSSIPPISTTYIDMYYRYCACEILIANSIDGRPESNYFTVSIIKRAKRVFRMYG
jgi:hypothetical protein